MFCNKESKMYMYVYLIIVRSSMFKNDFFFCWAVQLSGPSMIPTFNVKQDGDLVITEHLSAQFRTIKK